MVLETFNCILAREGLDGIAFDCKSVQRFWRLNGDRHSVATRECSVTAHLARRAGPMELKKVAKRIHNKKDLGGCCKKLFKSLEFGVIVYIFVSLWRERIGLRAPPPVEKVRRVTSFFCIYYGKSYLVNFPLIRTYTCLMCTV